MDGANLSRSYFNNSFNSSFIFNGDDIYFDNPFDNLGIRIIFVFVYILVFALCISGNAMVLFAIIRSPRLRSMTNFLLANLAVADFSVGVFCVLPNLSTFIQPKWILGRAMCKIYYYIWNVSYIASIIILTVVAMERYIAILHPLKARHFMTNSRLILVQIVIWLIALLYNIPFLVFYDTISFSEINKEFCYVSSAHGDSLKWLSLANVLMWYFIPLLLMSCIYYRIVKALWKTSVVSAMRLQPYPEEEDSVYRANSNRIKHYNQDITRNEASRDKHEVKSLGVRYDHQRKTSSDRETQCAENAIFTFKGNHTVTLVCGFRNKSEDSPQGNVCFFRFVTSRLSSENEARDVSLETNQHDEYTESLPITVRKSFRQNRYKETYLLNSRRVARARRKVIRLLICVVVTFGICVLPHMMKVLNHYWNIFALPNLVNTILSPISFILLYLNSVLNPFLYAMFSTNFRKSFKESLPCFRKRKTELREMQ